MTSPIHAKVSQFLRDTCDCYANGEGDDLAGFFYLRTEHLIHYVAKWQSEVDGGWGRSDSTRPAACEAACAADRSER